MSKYERINSAITDLPPESASRVFTFINILFIDKQLDKRYFKQEFIHFSIKEQYFICFYIRIYFGSHPDSYLQRWLHQEVNDEGYFYFLTEQGTILIENAENQIEYI